jgi:hypothetical protein
VEGLQIYDDVQGPRPTPEQQARIRVWFDELVASGQIKVLTVELRGSRVTFISKGDARAETTEE